MKSLLRPLSAQERPAVKRSSAAPVAPSEKAEQEAQTVLMRSSRKLEKVALAKFTRGF